MVFSKFGAQTAPASDGVSIANWLNASHASVVSPSFFFLSFFFRSFFFLFFPFLFWFANWSCESCKHCVTIFLSSLKGSFSRWPRSRYSGCAHFKTVHCESCMCVVSAWFLETDFLQWPWIKVCTLCELRQVCTFQAGFVAQIVPPPCDVTTWCNCHS